MDQDNRLAQNKETASQNKSVIAGSRSSICKIFLLGNALSGSCD